MENSKKTYWPHMIVGFLFIGLGLGYWTLKSASRVPIERENTFMMDYQDADTNYNEIIEQQEKFRENYNIDILNTKIIQVKKDKNSRMAFINPIELSHGENQFSYKVVDKNGNEIKDANVSFLLTRPHTDRDDQKIGKIHYMNGAYQTPKIQIENPGRYTLDLKVTIGKVTGYLESAAYLPN